jgi:hypothetical protein
LLYYIGIFPLCGSGSATLCWTQNDTIYCTLSHFSFLTLLHKSINQSINSLCREKTKMFLLLVIKGRPSIHLLRIPRGFQSPILPLPHPTWPDGSTAAPPLFAQNRWTDGSTRALSTRWRLAGDERGDWGARQRQTGPEHTDNKITQMAWSRLVEPFWFLLCTVPPNRVHYVHWAGSALLSVQRLN